MSPLVNLGIKAARNAGNIIVRYIDQLDRLAVEKKGRNDFVSEVDRMAEDEIIEVIQYAYPDHKIIAEESGTERTSERAMNDQTSNPSEIEWIIDPLDGTTNFLHGHPDFSVSIGIRENGKMEHGIIYDPLRNEMFTASRSKGAQLNERRIRVSGQSKLKDCLVTVGYPSRDFPEYENWMKTFNTVMRRSASIRHTGSAALDLAYVAAGRTDAFWEPSLKIWDIAAGSLIVREARGLVSDFQGQQDFLQNGDVVCGNPKIFSELLSIINPQINEKA